MNKENEVHRRKFLEDIFHQVYNKQKHKTLLIITICSREKAIKNEEHVVQLGGAHHHNNEVAGSSHATNRGNKREKKVAKYLKTCSSIYIITIKAAQYQGSVLHCSTI